MCKKCLLNAVASTTRQFELNNKTKYIYNSTFTCSKTLYFHISYMVCLFSACFTAYIIFIRLFDLFCMFAIFLLSFMPVDCPPSLPCSRSVRLVFIFISSLSVSVLLLPLLPISTIVSLYFKTLCILRGVYATNDPIYFFFGASTVRFE